MSNEFETEVLRLLRKIAGELTDEEIAQKHKDLTDRVTGPELPPWSRWKELGYDYHRVRATVSDQTNANPAKLMTISPPDSDPSTGI